MKILIVLMERDQGKRKKGKGEGERRKGKGESRGEAGKATSIYCSISNNIALKQCDI